MPRDDGVLAVFADVSRAAAAVRALRGEGMEVRASSPAYFPELAESLGRPTSLLGFATLTGAVAGGALGLLLAVGTSWSWPIMVGGMPIVSLPAFLVIVFVFSVIKRSDVYREAFNRASSDPRVIAALGTPIDKGWWVMGKVNVDTEGGNANIDFPISGPKGNAKVHAAATYEGNAWKYSSLIVRPDTGPEIDILQP